MRKMNEYSHEYHVHQHASAAVFKLGHKGDRAQDQSLVRSCPGHSPSFISWAPTLCSCSVVGRGIREKCALGSTSHGQGWVMSDIHSTDMHRTGVPPPLQSYVKI